MWKYLCKSHIRLHNRLLPCKTRRIIPVRTSPRASPTLCGNSAPLCRLHTPGNSRSHPGPSVCSAASRRSAPRCIYRGSSPRTWRWGSTPPHPALEVRTAQWWGEKTSLDAARAPWLCGGLPSVAWAPVFVKTQRSGPPFGDLSGVTYGASGCMVISDEQLCFAHGLPSSISSFRCCRPFLPASPLFRNPVGKWDQLWSGHPGIEIGWPDVISYLWFVFVWATKPPKQIASVFSWLAFLCRIKFNMKEDCEKLWCQ